MIRKLIYYRSMWRWKWWPRLSYIVFGGCEGCGSWRGVADESSRTEYHYTGPKNSPADPNRMRRFCRGCAADHHEYWDNMWNEYHASRY